MLPYIDKMYSKLLYFYSSRYSSGVKIPIICFPKTASTFTQNVINYCISGKHPPELLNSNYKLSLDERKIIINSKYSGARHMHITGQIGHIDLLNKYNIVPIFLVRNIYDVLISIQDHVKDIGFMSEGPYIPKYYLNVSDEKQKKILITLVLPWLIHFYISWVDNQDVIKLNIFRYENMLEDKVGFFDLIFKAYNLNIEKRKIQEAVDFVEGKKHKINFNKGIAGRGEELFSCEQKDTIERYLENFNVDFSHIL